jgi:hypothetical protein
MQRFNYPFGLVIIGRSSGFKDAFNFQHVSWKDVMKRNSIDPNALKTSHIHNGFIVDQNEKVSLVEGNPSISTI